MNKPDFIFNPLGGLGQIGSNFMLLEANQTNILIDCGILFPSDDCYGLNYLVPNFKDLSHLDYLVITHGHEDHIGAIQHIIDAFPQVKIYAPPFAIHLIRHKLGREVQIEEYRSKTKFLIEDIVFNPVQVNHSIPDTFGLHFHLKDSNHCYFFASDFKIDTQAWTESKFDLEYLNQISTKFTYKYLFADSTNIASQREIGQSEYDVYQELDQIIKGHKGRVIVTSFSSNINRIRSLLEIAKKTNKKVVLYGRAVQNYTKIAHQLGFLPEWEQYARDIEKVNCEEEHIYICSGCQGEFRATLNRVANNTDSHLKIKESDLVIFSSKPIPGNEKNIALMVNKLTELGATIITANDRLVHVSGHAYKNELLALYQAYRPTTIVPIHGESYFLKKHCRYIKESYPQAESIFLLNNQSLIINSDGGHSISEKENPGLLYFLSQRVEVPQVSLKERRKLAQQGAIFLSYDIAKGSYTFTLMGLPIVDEEKLSQFIHQNIIKNNIQCDQEAKVLLRQFFKGFYSVKPECIIHINSLKKSSFRSFFKT